MLSQYQKERADHLYNEKESIKIRLEHNRIELDKINVLLDDDPSPALEAELQDARKTGEDLVDSQKKGYWRLSYQSISDMIGVEITELKSYYASSLKKGKPVEQE